MRILNKKSSVLTLATLCLLILIIAGGLFTLYLTGNISTDAETINRLGAIRGSTQRLVKLELSDMDNEKVKKDIEKIIEQLSQEETKFYYKDKEIKSSIEELNIIWSRLNKHINKYRLNPTDKNKEELILASEEIWEGLDNIVLMSQLSSEVKVNKYRLIFLILGVDALLAVTIIFLIRKYVRDTLEYLVDHDVLTNIYNKKYFNERIEHEIAKAEKCGNDLSLMILDIDYFKKINDNYGHDIGDVVLREMSEIIKNNIGKNEMLFRVGGEEFAIIAPNTNLEKNFDLAEKIRRSVEDHEFNYLENSITISIGVSEYEKGDDCISLFKRADIALYDAKDSGRNKVC